MLVCKYILKRPIKYIVIVKKEDELEKRLRETEQKMEELEELVSERTRTLLFDKTSYELITSGMQSSSQTSVEEFCGSLVISRDGEPEEGFSLPAPRRRSPQMFTESPGASLTVPSAATPPSAHSRSATPSPPPAITNNYLYPNNNNNNAANQFVCRIRRPAQRTQRHRAAHLTELFDPTRNVSLGLALSIVKDSEPPRYPFVTGVDANSPAERAGVRVGDVVLEINRDSTFGKSKRAIIQLIRSLDNLDLTISRPA